MFGRKTSENVEKVREILNNSNGRKSISKISSITGISKTTTRRIMKEDLKKFPYNPTVSKKISDLQRNAFCQRLVTMAEEENFELKKIIFSDESHGYLDDVPNLQNNRS